MQPLRDFRHYVSLASNESENAVCRAVNMRHRYSFHSKSITYWKHGAQRVVVPSCLSTSSPLQSQSLSLTAVVVYVVPIPDYVHEYSQ